MSEGRFEARLVAESSHPLRRGRTTTLQVNVGKLCNQACLHCHVEAGPGRKERMSLETMGRVVELLGASRGIHTVDITGGAPELNPGFRLLVDAATAQGHRVIDRCNLTVLFEPEMEWVAPYLASKGVDVVASLPCYLEDNVDAQRGDGVFDASIRGLRLLNELGYGQPGSDLGLDLVYNPQGPSLPPPQESLEADYKRELKARYGVVFDSLLTLTNMPINRFLWSLTKTGEIDDYRKLLEVNFNKGTVSNLMCRETLSISWDGRFYDCDFNQMLGLELAGGASDLWSVSSFDGLEEAVIAMDDHCFGCTAGAGSSCAGTLV